MPRTQRRRERGAAAVEFAIILPILLMLVGGVIDFGRLYWTQIMLSNAARDGVRLAAMGSTTYTAAQVQSRTVTAAAPLTVATSGVTVTQCGAGGTSASVVVVPQTAFGWTVLGFVPGIPTPSPSGKATMTCT
jgi:Flp pilus assembly protein TadG